MVDKPEAALQELNQTILILSRVRKKFNDPPSVKELTTYDLIHLRDIHQRVRQLCSEIFGSTNAFDAWVGTIREINEDQSTRKIQRLDSELADRLFTYVQGLVYDKKSQEDIERLTQENANLRGQLTELRQRESTYLSIIEKAKTFTPPEVKDILLKSLRRQATFIASNLSNLQETKAKSGINVPLDVLNGITQLEEELEQVSSRITELENQNA